MTISQWLCIGGIIFHIVGVITLSLYVIWGTKKVLRIFGKGKTDNAVRKVVNARAKKGEKEFSVMTEVKEYYERKFVIYGIICVVIGEILNAIAICS